jgi:hypothetical protein
MTTSEIEKCRNRLEQFSADLLEPLGRRERRHWNSVYVRGLLREGERKSVEPMAARLPEGNVQAMQQLTGRRSKWLGVAEKPAVELASSFLIVHLSLATREWEMKSDRVAGGGVAAIGSRAQTGADNSQ